MTRWYKLFATTQERNEWESKMKKGNKNFRVCMRMTANQLAKDLYMNQEDIKGFKYATVYTTDTNQTMKGENHGTV